MKKVLLFSTLLISALSVFAYETVIINFPENTNWVKGYYKKSGNEALLQYVPKGQTSNHWTQSIVIHSYNNSAFPVSVFMSNNSLKMMKVNPTARYKTLRQTKDDMISGRCTEDYGNIKGQCEFFRVAQAHGGIITIHYMNKNKEEFMADYNKWFNIIKKAKFYNSYYRDERILNKSEFFEL